MRRPNHEVPTIDRNIGFKLGDYEAYYVGSRDKKKSFSPSMRGGAMKRDILPQYSILYKSIRSRQLSL